MTTIASNLRDALRAVRSASPDAIRAIDAAEKAALAEAEKAAKRQASLAEKINQALPERTAAIAADWLALQAEAINEAAEALARRQLEAEHGAIDPRTLALQGYPPARLATSKVEHALRKMIDTTPVPWDRAGRTAAVVRSGGQRAASEAAAAAEPRTEADDVEARIAARTAMLAEQRTKAIADRKRAAKLPGWTETAA